METSIIPGKFGPKNEIYSQCYEIGHSEQVKFVNLKYDILKLRILTRSLTNLVTKLQCVPTFMKSGTQWKSNMLIMNMVLGTEDPDPKLQIRTKFVPALKLAPIFMKYCTHNKWNMLIMNIILAMAQSDRVFIASE